MSFKRKRQKMGVLSMLSVAINTTANKQWFVKSSINFINTIAQVTICICVKLVTSCAANSSDQWLWKYRHYQISQPRWVVRFDFKVSQISRKWEKSEIYFQIRPDLINFLIWPIWGQSDPLMSQMWPPSSDVTTNQ